MPTLEETERRTTLATAVARYDTLRRRDSLADPEDPAGGPAPLSCEESLELLALGEVIARKAGYGRQLGVRRARATGASWAEIGRALGQTRQSAWEAHTRWIEELARAHDSTGAEGLDSAAATAARTRAGSWDEDPG